MRVYFINALQNPKTKCYGLHICMLYSNHTRYVFAFCVCVCVCVCACVSLLIYVLKSKSINSKTIHFFLIIIVRIPSYKLLLTLYNIPTIVTDEHGTGKLNRRNRNEMPINRYILRLRLFTGFAVTVLFYVFVPSPYHLSTDLLFR